MYRNSFSLSPLSLAILAATLSPVVSADEHNPEVTVMETMIVEATKQNISLQQVDSSVLIKTGKSLRKQESMKLRT